MKQTSYYNIKDYEYLILNDRIGIQSKNEEDKNKILNFTQQDQDLINEYNKQYEKDENFLMPPIIPDIEQPNLINVLSQEDLNFIVTNINKLHNNIELLINEITAINDTVKFMNTKLKKKNLSLNTRNIYREQIPILINKKKDKEREKDTLKIEYENLNDIIKQNQQDIYLNNQEIERINKEGRQKMTELNEDIKKNYPSFNLYQLPQETQQEYMERLQKHSEIDQNFYKLENAKQQIENNFKEKLKELNRNNIINEIVINTFDNTTKLNLLKTWNNFKTEYIKNFGNNNKYINDSDIIEFIKAYLNNNLPKNEKNKYTISDNTFIIDNKLYFKIARTPQSHLILLYSFSGNKGTYSQYIDKIAHLQETTTQNKIYNVIRSIDDIYNKVGISANDLSTFFYKVNATNISKLLYDKYKLIPVDYNQLFKISETTINGKNKIEYGYGIKLNQLDKKAEFGKLIINLHKLYYNNILSVKYKNGISVPAIKNTLISDNFVNLLFNLIQNNIKPTKDDINNLKVNEHNLYNELIFLAQLNKDVVNNHTEAINNLKNRMAICEGEIEAGNDNQLLKKELYDICHALYYLKVINKKDLTSYIKQFK